MSNEFIAPWALGDNIVDGFKSPYSWTATLYLLLNTYLNKDTPRVFVFEQCALYSFYAASVQTTFILSASSMYKKFILCYLPYTAQLFCHSLYVPHRQVFQVSRLLK